MRRRDPEDGPDLGPTVEEMDERRTAEDEGYDRLREEEDRVSERDLAVGPIPGRAP